MKFITQLVRKSLLFLLAPVALHAQMFEQVYPEFEYAEIRGGTHWNGDTLYLCGLNQMLLRTTDAGTTWENQMSGLRDWCFYDIAAADEGLFLLAEPTVFYKEALPERQLATLLRFDPHSNTLDMIECPRLSASGDEYPTSLHDLTSAKDALFLLQGNSQDGLLLHRSVDGGENWTNIPLSDSLNGDLSFVVCYDSSHLAVIASLQSAPELRRVFTTKDGGKTWNPPPVGEIAKNGVLWMSENELVAFVDEGPIISSTDGGISWRQRSFPPTSIFLDAVSIGADRGYVQGGFGEVFRTDDGFRTFLNISNDAAGQYLIPNGRDRLVNVGSASDDIYLTLDGGLSWDFIRKAELMFWELRMASDTVGVAMVESVYRDRYLYYRTTDGWETMTQILDQSNPFFPEYFIGSRMYPVTETLWYMVQPSVPDHAILVHRSTNGGTDWEEVLSVNDLGETPVSGAITVVDLPDTTYFGIILEHNLVVTSDRGESWQISNLLNQSTFSTTMQLRPNASSWMISGDGVFGRDTVWRCEAGWENWEPVIVDPDTVGAWSHFRQIQIAPNDDVLILADFDSQLGYQYDWSYIFRSSDDGATWELYPTSFRVATYSAMDDGGALVFTSPANSTMYDRTRGGELRRSHDGWKSYTSEDVLYQRAYTGIPVTEENALYVSDRYSILRNLTGGINDIETAATSLLGLTIETPYPHPVGRSEPVFIPLHLSRPGHAVHVSLHDVLGRRIRDIFDGRVVNEFAHVTWNTIGLAPGVYIIRAQSGNAISVKPVLVAR